MTAELVGMVFLCIIVWTFFVAPAGIAFIFEPPNCSYKESVIMGLGFTALMLGVAFITIASSLCISFVVGDMTPITTLIERIKG